jgi:hypothetical protein
VTLIAGTLSLGVALPDLATEIVGDLDRVGTRIERVLGAMVGG